MGSSEPMSSVSRKMPALMTCTRLVCIKHLCDFQMFYVLKGWIKFVYEGEGEHTFQAGDCVLQPAGIVHNELDCSDDLEVLEIYSPAIHQTVAVGKMPAAAD